MLKSIQINDALHKSLNIDKATYNLSSIMKVINYYREFFIKIIGKIDNEKTIMKTIANYNLFTNAEYDYTNNTITINDKTYKVVLFIENVPKNEKSNIICVCGKKPEGFTGEIICIDDLILERLKKVI